MLTLIWKTASKTGPTVGAALGLKDTSVLDVEQLSRTCSPSCHRKSTKGFEWREQDYLRIGYLTKPPIASATHDNNL